MTGTGTLAMALVFVWFGLVVGLSLIETPLKFRAPGITLALGLGIGRLVFGVLGKVEAVLLVAAAVATGWVPGAQGLRIGLLAALAVLVAGQVLLLRPRLDRRAQVIIDGGTPPPSHLHVAYILAEGVKLVLLIVLGIALARGQT